MNRPYRFSRSFPRVAAQNARASGMEEQSVERSGGSAGSNQATPVAWRDLREWIALVEANGLLKRIDKPVDADEELAAIAYLATRREDAPALMFDDITGDRTGASILTNMLGSSKERYALAVGLDPSLSTAEMIEATRDIMQRRIKPVPIAKDKAPVNEVVLRGNDIDLTQFPVPKFWPGDGGHFIGTGDITLTSSPTPAASMSAATGRCCMARSRIGLYCSPGKHGLLDREAWWARGEPCEVVAAYGIDPVLFMLAAQVFGIEESELDVAGGIMGRGDRTDRSRIREPADPRQCRARDRGPAASGRHGGRRPARRIHRLLRPRALAAAGDRGEGGASPQLADLHRGADGEISVLRDRRLLRDHALGAHPRRSRPHRRVGRASAPMRIRPRRPAGAWWWCRCSSNMPAMPRRCWR